MIGVSAHMEFICTHQKIPSDIMVRLRCRALFLHRTQGQVLIQQSASASGPPIDLHSEQALVICVHQEVCSTVPEEGSVSWATIDRRHMDLLDQRASGSMPFSQKARAWPPNHRQLREAFPSKPFWCHIISSILGLKAQDMPHNQDDGTKMVLKSPPSS